MTVKELIQVLTNLPPNHRVLVDGYEGGLCDITAPKLARVKLDVNKEDFYGPHEEIDGADIQAVKIPKIPNPNSN